jgi:molybdopterin-guanine dinucleotide biosynthesis protein A
MIFDAVVLAGGKSSRLGGHPKSELRFETETLLQRTLTAVQDARQVVIVGEPGTAALSPTTIVTRESPVFGGPAAAIAAGLAAATGEPAVWVVVLACDMPSVARAVPLLLDRVFDGFNRDGVLAEDNGQQLLLACYRRAALEVAIAAHAGSIAGMSVRDLVRGLSTAAVPVPAGSSADVDTWADAAAYGITTLRTDLAGAHCGGRDDRA